MVTYHITLSKNESFEMPHFGSRIVCRKFSNIEVLNGIFVYGFKQSEEDVKYHDNLKRFNVAIIECSKTREDVEIVLGKLGKVEFLNKNNS